MVDVKKQGYHHGDLRAAVLEEAARVIHTDGVSALSLRELARGIGVSHTAPAHHFGDRRGVLTALAAQGFTILADTVLGQSADLRSAGVAYVRFALAHPAHFTVMFSANLLNAEDPNLTTARKRAFETLTGGVAGHSPDGSHADAALAAWSLMHGFATLWLGGALAESKLAAGQDPEALAGRIAIMLFA